MNFIRNRNFRAGPQTSLEGFICPQNSDKQQKIKVFGRSEGGGNFSLIYTEKTDFTPIYAKKYPPANGFCCTFASEKIKRRCETLSSSFTYTRITMGFR